MSKEPVIENHVQQSDTKGFLWCGSEHLLQAWCIGMEARSSWASCYNNKNHHRCKYRFIVTRCTRRTTDIITLARDWPIVDDFKIPDTGMHKPFVGRLMKKVAYSVSGWGTNVLHNLSQRQVPAFNSVHALAAYTGLVALEQSPPKSFLKTYPMHPSVSRI